MARRYGLIVFDWDGTLLDSAGAIVAAICAAARDIGVPEPAEARARHVIGLGLADALAHAVPDLAVERYPELVARYRHHYLSCDHELSLFSGVETMLRDLQHQGATLAIATGKSRFGLNRALANSGLAALFAATRCADECFSKPHPQMLIELMTETGFSPEATLMIGDTTHDLQMAGNAGVTGLGVAYGAHSREALDTAGPLAVFDQVLELHQWLTTNG